MQKFDCEQWKALSLFLPAQQQHQHSAYQLLSNTITSQPVSYFTSWLTFRNRESAKDGAVRNGGRGIVGMWGEIAWGESECTSAIRPHSPPLNGVYLTFPLTTPLVGFAAMHQQTCQPASQNRAQVDTEILKDLQSFFLIAYLNLRLAILKESQLLAIGLLIFC